MKLLIAGATGFLGRALILRLQRDGHGITAWVRDPRRARDQLGPDVTLVAAGDTAALDVAIAGADAVVNLAGEPIVGPRWTRRRKRVLTDSRVGPTTALVEAMHRRRGGPLPVFVSASAVGYYGDRGDDDLAEDTLPGAGFAAALCRDWEAAAARAPAARVVLARIGVVLGREGGALAPLARITSWGLGGPIAGGRQWVPWIHLEDLVESLVACLEEPSLRGPVNLVAPHPVRQREQAGALGRALGRWAGIPAPRFAMRALLGEAATVLTASQRVQPRALERIGFGWRFPTIDRALADLTGPAGVEVGPITGVAPQTEYLARRRPRARLVARTTLEAPLAEVLPFFADADNLNLLVPPAMRFAIQTPRPITMGVGTTIDYRLRILGVPARWRTVIEAWQPERAGAASFVDAQHRGPYRAWWHEHHFVADGDRTHMEDRVYYASPLGPLGWLADRLVVRGQLRRIFGFRAQAVRLRFGARRRAAPVAPAWIPADGATGAAAPMPSRPDLG